MWASSVELALAAENEGISLIYSDGGKIMKIGQGPLSGVIKRHGSHFVLYNTYAKAVKNNGKHNMERGGIYVPGVQQRKSHVKIIPVCPVEINDLTVNIDTMTVADLKTYLAPILRIQVSMVTLVELDGEQEVPDWTEPPEHLRTSVNNAAPKIKTDVRLSQKISTLSIYVEPRVARDQIEERLSKILQVIPHFLDIKTEMGRPFTSSAHVQSKSLVVTLVGEA